MTPFPGIVFLVGAGPGDPGLITRRGLALLRLADVVAVDRLIGPEILTEIRPGAEIIYVGKTTKIESIPQERINDLLIDHARAGRSVVRLKGGDPFVFGRGYEEWAACHAAGIECVVVPGVTSAVAGPAAAGIPITHRRFVRSFAVFSAHAAEECEAPPLDYRALASIDTLVVLMGRETLGEVTQSLIAAGRTGSTPVACIEQATTSQQRVVLATLATLADEADRNVLRAPIVTVIGDVARFAEVPIIGTQSAEPPAAPSTGSNLAAHGRSGRGLAGLRIVITRPRSAGTRLGRLLTAAGAIPIRAPMIAIAGPPSTGQLDDALRHLDRYDWIVFTSVHGVRGVWKRLSALGLDSRAVGNGRVAAVGPMTARALRRRGITADLVPTTHSGAGLGDALAAMGAALGRVLCPRSDLAGPELPTHLRKLGANVEEVIAYRTQEVRPPEPTLRLIRDGVDAIVFHSPSAVRQFAALKLQPGRAVVACIGPTTARAGQEAGFRPAVIATEQTAAGVVGALAEYISRAKREPVGPESTQVANDGDGK